MEKYKQSQLLNAAKKGFDATVNKILSDQDILDLTDEKFKETLVESAIDRDAHKTLSILIKNCVVSVQLAAFKSLRSNRVNCLRAALDYADRDDIKALSFVCAENYFRSSDEMKSFLESAELDLHKFGIIF